MDNKPKISDIKRLCDAKIYERGYDYYQDGRVQKRLRKGNLVTAEVLGTHPYLVSIYLLGNRVEASCSCPYDWGGYCKHIVATLLALAAESESFKELSNIRGLLSKKSKDELVSVILNVVNAQPELIRDLELDSEEGEKYDAIGVVSNIFNSLGITQDWSINSLIQRLQIIVGKAEEFQERGDFDLARSIYFEIVKRCLEIENTYGSIEIFPDSFILDMIEKYQSLALNDDNFDKKRTVIQKEVDELLKYEISEFIEIRLEELIAALNE